MADKKKIIEVRCTGSDALALAEMTPLQGEFKELSKENAARLKQSIIEHGFWFPFFVWKNNSKNYYIDGHQRDRVLPLLAKDGYKLPDKYPVIYIEAKNKKEAAEAILLQTSKYGRYSEKSLYEFIHEFELDFDSLKLEVSLPEINLDEFEVGWIDDASGDSKVDEDEIPEPPQVAVSKLGDLWLLGNHRLLSGDATKKEDVERLMAGEKADMVFTDPPYGVDYASKNEFLNAYDKGNRIQTDIANDQNPEKTFELWGKSFEIMAQFLNKINSFYICSPQSRNLMMMMMMIQRGGFYISSVIIWVKNNHVLGRQDYFFKHEPLIYGWLKKGTHKFYGKGNCNTTVWNFDKPLKSDLHPTMKPIPLIQEALLNSSIENQIIIDFFLGSGSTLIACEKTNRICYGMEIEPIYVDVAIQRWQDFTDKEAVREDGIKFNELKAKRE